ncbi:4-galactosyl-N-acetylglucosaminide 3-alpha-L-fucosyltransferase FUT6-like [Dryobates pubescens]|uniref:4-galactosyl-N-acetylglucosaminide 3-alpha-L-fucosyltransferase FUT6-like n=1 Tax=Dryobates pubescens TaxID=118200 RepID=UPI0023BA2614|nr:4-galactosyl-N-acetylglucosaminide 3-alpha-L-fucosyltransferase FUT6-like [Dryobates pubescens]
MVVLGCWLDRVGSEASSSRNSSVVLCLLSYLHEEGGSDLFQALMLPPHAAAPCALVAVERTKLFRGLPQEGAERPRPGPSLPAGLGDAGNPCPFGTGEPQPGLGIADPSMEPVEGKKFSKKLIALPLGLILGFCLFLYLHQLKTPWLEKHTPRPPPPPAPAKKSSPPPPLPAREDPRLTILLWQWPFGQHFDFLNCSEHYSTPDCHFTVNRSWSQKAHAVVIHHRDVCWDPQKLTQIPRLQSQRWIWFNLESPSHSPNLRAMNNLFNLTMSYRKDSDIFTPYGELQLLGEPQPFSIPTKTKLVAWVVSNWVESSRRVRYYRELKDHIKVDIYGSHHLPLPHDQLLTTLAQYKFYLAFENSQHEDYITEKLWRNALSSGTVPVVLGPSRENYERFLPPDSFIHINDFATAKELAHYLQELSEDAERYQSYFQWRRWLKPNAAFNWAIDLCRACRFLHTTQSRYQVVPDLSQWFV